MICVHVPAVLWVLNSLQESIDTLGTEIQRLSAQLHTYEAHKR